MFAQDLPVLSEIPGGPQDVLHVFPPSASSLGCGIVTTSVAVWIVFDTPSGLSFSQRFNVYNFMAEPRRDPLSAAVLDDLPSRKVFLAVGDSKGGISFSSLSSCTGQFVFEPSLTVQLDTMDPLVAAQRSSSGNGNVQFISLSRAVIVSLQGVKKSFPVQLQSVMDVTASQVVLQTPAINCTSNFLRQSLISLQSNASTSALFLGDYEDLLSNKATSVQGLSSSLLILGVKHVQSNGGVSDNDEACSIAMFENGQSFVLCYPFTSYATTSAFAPQFSIDGKSAFVLMGASEDLLLVYICLLYYIYFLLSIYICSSCDNSPTASLIQVSLGSSSQPTFEPVSCWDYLEDGSAGTCSWRLPKRPVFVSDPVAGSHYAYAVLQDGITNSSGILRFDLSQPDKCVQIVRGKVKQTCSFFDSCTCAMLAPSNDSSLFTLACNSSSGIRPLNTRDAAKFSNDCDK